MVKLVERLLGIVVPDDYPVSRFNGPAPESFYREIAGQEMRKMIAMVDDPATLAPFVGLEHFGGPQLTADELRHILAEMERNGLGRFVFYRYESITDEVWNVLKEFTGSAY